MLKREFHCFDNLLSLQVIFCDHGCDEATRQFPAKIRLPDRPVWVLRWLRSLWEHLKPAPGTISSADRLIPLTCLSLSLSQSGWCTLMCPLCAGCSIASDMDECCLCGLGMPIRSVYRTRYNIKVRSPCPREVDLTYVSSSEWAAIKSLQA